MRITALLAALGAALTLPLAAAGELRGIPTDVDLALSISYETAAKSRLRPALQAMQRRLEKLAEQADPEASRRNKAFAASLGVTPDSSRHLDLGLRLQDGPDGPDLALFVAAHIDMRKAAFDAFAKNQGVSPVAVGELAGWELKSLFPALLQAVSGKPDEAGLSAEMLDGYAVAMPADNLMLVAPIRELGKSHDTWRGKSPGYAYPEPVRRAAAAVPLCHTTLHANLGRILSTASAEPGASGQEPAGGLQSVSLHLGEDSKDVRVVAHATYRTEAQAKLGAGQLQALIPVVGAAAMPDDADDEAARFLKPEVAAFVASIKVEQTGASLRVTATHPIERLETFLSKAETLLGEIASSVGAGAPAPARPAAKLEPAATEKEGKKGR